MWICYLFSPNRNSYQVTIILLNLAWLFITEAFFISGWYYKTLSFIIFVVFRKSLWKRNTDFSSFDGLFSLNSIVAHSWDTILAAHSLWYPKIKIFPTHPIGPNKPLDYVILLIWIFSSNFPIFCDSGVLLSQKAVRILFSSFRPHNPEIIDFVLNSWKISIKFYYTLKLC